jgi:hypothetical protein
VCGSPSSGCVEGQATLASAPLIYVCHWALPWLCCSRRVRCGRPPGGPLPLSSAQLVSMCWCLPLQQAGDSRSQTLHHPWKCIASHPHTPAQVLLRVASFVQFALAQNTPRVRHHNTWAASVPPCGTHLLCRCTAEDLLCGTHQQCHHPGRLPGQTDTRRVATGFASFCWRGTPAHIIGVCFCV